jgi:hypothetical protein
MRYLDAPGAALVTWQWTIIHVPAKADQARTWFQFIVRPTRSAAVRAWLDLLAGVNMGPGQPPTWAEERRRGHRCVAIMVTLPGARRAAR